MMAKTKVYTYYFGQKKKVIKDALIKLVSLLLWIYNNFIFYQITNFQIMTHIPKK